MMGNGGIGRRQMELFVGMAMAMAMAMAVVETAKPCGTFREMMTGD